LKESQNEEFDWNKGAYFNLTVKSFPSINSSHWENEQVPVGFVIQMQADHLLHHVERIRAILREGGGA
jgi:hypothetical protein